MPANFPVSARLGELPFFVIEADEYDTAFFDKRAKFVHYRPRTLILNNLEFDHADIYPDLAAIERQVHHLVRTVPGSGRLVVNAADANLQRVLQTRLLERARGLRGGRRRRRAVERARCRPAATARRSRCSSDGAARRATVHWPLLGTHNVDNALAAIAAARHAGVPVERSIEALAASRA